MSAALRLGGRLPAVVRYALLALAGMLQAFSIAWPWGEKNASGTLQIVTLAAALWLMTADSQIAASGADAAPASARQRFWQGFRRGWCFTAAWLAATFWWLYVSLHVYGGLPAWLAALAVLLLAAALSLYYTLACGLWLRLRKKQGQEIGAVRQVLLFAALWLLAELCRGVLFTGFPWGAIGYAHVDGWLAGYAPWLGVYGMSALAAGASAVVWQLLQSAKLLYLRASAGQGAGASGRCVPWGAVAMAGVFAAVLLMGGWHKQTWGGKLQPLATGNGLSVALLQGNIPQEEKFQPNSGMELALDWYGQQMVASQADLLVLPETALPMLPQQLPDGYWQALQQRFAQGEQTALIGTPAGDMQAGYANAAVGMAAGGVQTVGNGAASGEAGFAQQADFYLPPAQQAEYRYAKHHLVPFGEFIPWGFQWFVNMLNMPLGSFQRGALIQPRLLVQGERLQPNICYEDLFGEELAASFVDAATAPTILVNMSNIAWFGDTVAIDQHRNISRMRAMELARPMLRATNTGATAVIDATGQVVQELPRLTRGVLEASVKGNYAQPTFFAWWAARWGLWPLWLLGLASAACAVWAWPGRKRIKT